MGLDNWQDFWQEEIQIADQANPNRAQNQGHGMNQVEKQEIKKIDEAVKAFTASHEENQEKMNSIVKLNDELCEQINFFKQLHQPPTTTTPQQQMMLPGMRALNVMKTPSMMYQPPSMMMNQIPAIRYLNKVFQKTFRGTLCAPKRHDRRTLAEHFLIQRNTTQRFIVFLWNQVEGVTS